MGLSKTPLNHSTLGFQRILQLLAEKSNLSSLDISNEAYIGLKTLTCAGYLRALHSKNLAERKIFISGWRKTPYGFTTALYSLGAELDVQRPRLCDMERNTPGMQRVLDVLITHGPLTYREAAELSGVPQTTVKNSRYLEILNEQNRVHIQSWRRNRSGPMIAVYAAGPGRAAEKPEVFSEAQKSHRHRDKKRILNLDRSLMAQLNPRMNIARTLLRHADNQSFTG